MDIDIDLRTDFDPRKIFKQIVLASRVENGELVKHPCGVYFQNIPIDPITSLSAIPFKEAEQLGYFKIDFLHLSVLDHFTSKEEIRALLQKPPNWDLLLDEAQVDKLFQLREHKDLLRKIRPRSVEELADCVALIRPSKVSLINTYVMANKEERKKLRDLLYEKTTDGKPWFKRAHAIAYALTIVLQLHLITLQRL